MQTQLTETDWGLLIKAPENLMSEDERKVLEFIAQGMLVVAEITKRTYNKKKLATVQDWTDMDGKLPNAIDFVQRIYREKTIYDFSYKTPPTGYLDKVGENCIVVMTDGNHRTAVAVDQDIAIGVRLVAKREDKVVRSFSIVLSPISRELMKMDY